MKSNNINEIALLTLFDGEKADWHIGILFCGEKEEG